MDVEGFWLAATGFAPYDYQRRLAIDGPPELLRVPTGCGKTAAAVLSWLYRRRFHADAAVRAATPRKLVIALPMRVLVDQYGDQIAAWLERLATVDDVGLHVLMGGVGRRARDWQFTPAQDAVVVGSIDMLLSRALNRGYAENRAWWPIEFGWLNDDSHWVFDEVQLMGPAVPTSRQLQAFRDQLGTWRPTSSLWMSATVEEAWLRTVDAGEVASVAGVSDADRAGPLAPRLGAAKLIRQLADEALDASAFADAIVERHRAGTRTLVFCNTVARARQVAASIVKTTDDELLDVVLVHSRMRPPDRAAATARVLMEGSAENGQIVVTTQAMEAGVDITSTTLITEACPWTSFIQRAGRCNRAGEEPDATIWWLPVNHPAPYEEGDVEAAAAALEGLDGRSVTGEDLVGVAVDTTRRPMLVLRRRDLDQLFDTSTDLSGGDIDVGPFIRDGNERDVYLAWRTFGDAKAPTDGAIRPSRDELCPAPLHEVRKWMGDRGVAAFEVDRATGEWVRATAAQLRPGLVLLVPVEAGGYGSASGWDPRSTVTVPDVATSPATPLEESVGASDEGIGTDPLSFIDAWVALEHHLADAERESRRLVDAFDLDASDARVDACVRAARLHDLGKVHDAFQRMLRGSAGPDEHVPPEVVLAKSSQRRRSRNERPFFRHELASALALLDPGCGVLDDCEERDLVVYLVAAHHGRIRMGIRGHPDETAIDGAHPMLGVIDGEQLPAVRVPGDDIPTTVLDVSEVARFGGARSWTRMVQRLVGRDDLGPFRLSMLEALVRLADFAASAEPSRTLDVSVRGGNG